MRAYLVTGKVIRHDWATPFRHVVEAERPDEATGRVIAVYRDLDGAERISARAVPILPQDLHTLEGVQAVL